jgi:MFS family permease
MYMASNGIVLNTFNLYLPEFAKEFGVDIGKATGLAATLYLVLALPLPFVGNLLEKFSPKKLIITGAIGAALLLPDNGATYLLPILIATAYLFAATVLMRRANFAPSTK